MVQSQFWIAIFNMDIEVKILPLTSEMRVE